MAPNGLLPSFLAAIQASLSVLLVIFYGAVAAKLKLLNADNTKSVSKICVRLFLPALLITKLGSELKLETADRYAIVFAWAVVCHLVSFLIGIVAHFWLGMPDWTTVALMFNNTTSYPLLLIGALDQTGILQSLVVGDETTSAAIERAKSYFLVFSTVSSCLTFAVGPRLIDTEHAPEDEGKEDEDEVDGEQSGDATEDGHQEANEESGLLNGHLRFANPFAENSFFPSTRKPSTAAQKPSLKRRASMVPKKHWARLSPRAQWWFLFIGDFFNAPLLGALIGFVIGLTPALHRAFFNDSNDGGIFTAWLTASLKNIGGLFVPLPVVIAGVSLYTAITGVSQGSKMPKGVVLFILAVRFVIWPAVSISLIYALASRTSILGDDPMLWFALMLMPAGPSAMKLISLVQVSNAEEGEEEHISKLLTISYLVSPILSFTVVGSLLASQAAQK